MRSTVGKGFVLLAAVVMLGAACSSNKSGTTTGGSAAPSASISGGGGTIAVGSDTANNHGSEDASGKSKLEVEQDNYYFAPTVITGKPGQKITIELKNDGSTLHNFTLESQTIDQDVQVGQDATVTVTFPQSGILEFYCKYHRSLGMVGELSVS
jgi:plastocyanin